MELKQGTIYKYIYTKMYLISECIESNTKKIHGYLSIADDKIDYYTWNNTCGASSSVILATEEEKQWYLACKKANKFISQEEALKLFKQETNLVGRYIKWLVTASYCKVFEKGEYSLITFDKNGTIKLENYVTSFSDLTYNRYNWELMPEGFTPPTMKQELTSLPEKWCIKPNSENWKEIFKWANFIWTWNTDNVYVFYRKTHSSENTENIIEITFDQFKAWVLKENVEEVPEYVECVKLPQGWSGSTKVGGIYKTDTTGYAKDTYRILCHDYGGQTTIGVEDHFRASTASAYNAQFKETSMDLLAEARKRFPPGTKFISPENGKNYTVLKDSYWKGSLHDSYLADTNNGSGQFIRWDGKWGEIISEAKQPEEEKWKVGGWVRITKDFEYRGISYKKGEVYKITYVNKTINPSVISVDALDKKVEMYTEFSSQIPECEWVGMEKPNSFGEQLNMKDIHTWSDWGPQNNLAYLLSSQEEPVRPQDWTVHAKKSKVQQVEVVPLQKPCIISTRKSKFKLQIN